VGACLSIRSKCSGIRLADLAGMAVLQTCLLFPYLMFAGVTFGLTLSVESVELKGSAD
jgi:hypothetical protein